MRAHGLVILMLGTSLAPVAAHAAPIAPPDPTAEARSPATIETIVVAARKRREIAQKTPVSITVVTAADLRKISARGFTDIQQLTPGLQFEGSSNNQYAAEINIRGQESNQQLLGIDPSVGIYVDGVYETSPLGLNLADLYGLSQIEVLKGPQGTLYGRNTTGGAINVTTRAPTDERSATLSQNFASYDTFVTSGDINAPIVPGKVDLRLDAQFATNGGFIKDLDRPLGANDSKSLRGALKLTPLDYLEVVIRGDYLSADGSGEPFQPISLTPASLGARAIARADGIPVASAPLAYIGNNGGIRPNYNDKAYDFPENGSYLASGGSVTATLDLGSVTLKSISAYRNFQQDNREDLDASVFNLLNAANSQAEDQYTQELQLVGDALHRRLSYVGGLYYYQTDAKDNSASGALGAVTPTLYRNHLGDQSGGAYGQTTYAILHNLHVTTGLRFTAEAKKLATQNSTGSKCNIPAQDHAAGNCTADFSTSANNLSYSLGLDYEPTSNTMLYFNNSRGFKSGGINERGTATQGSYAIFKPEIATEYEIGLKSDWLGKRLQVNAAGYHTDYTDIQRSATVLTAAGATTSITTNAARATIDGGELSMALVPFRHALMTATGAYTYPHYGSFTDALGNHGSQLFEGVSRFTYGLSAQYDVPLSFGTLTSNVNWFWRSSDELSPAATGFDLAGDHIQPGYGLLNARLTLSLPRWAATAAVYATNLTGTGYFTSILDLDTNVAARAVGTSIGQLGSPRVVGAELTKRF